MAIRKLPFVLFCCLLFVGCTGSGETDVASNQPSESHVPDVEAPDVEPPEVEPPEVEPPKVEPPDVDVPDVEPPEVEVPHVEPPKVEPPKVKVPEPKVPEIAVRAEDEQVKMQVPDTLLFDFDKSVLKPEAKEVLDDVSRMLQTYDGGDIQINGHTDNVGDDSYNVSLSKKRAEAVKKYLDDKQAISSFNVSVNGFGKEQPIAPNDSEANRQKNRRVEIIIEPKK